MEVGLSIRAGQFIDFQDGSFQTYCSRCHEPLLFFPGDRVVVIAGTGLLVECNKCWKKNEFLDVCDSAPVVGDDPDFPQMLRKCCFDFHRSGGMDVPSRRAYSHLVDDGGGLS